MAINLDSPRAVEVNTSDGVVGTSGRSTVVFAVVCKGGSATTRAQLYDGTDTTGTLQEDMIAPINDTVASFYGDKGVSYPTGCYLDITTTGGSVTVVYTQ